MRKILGSASDFWKFLGKRWRVEEFFVISLKVLGKNILLKVFSWVLNING